ncbi:helix-turn-helix domain-containing protein [Salibacterium halotolerans]|uniref:Helix-turn-helix domain-containing protein n=1 Tax=Salibacterium halotolerans TaxID=1884432 RepID=A0A1I5X576_9BACI|nr:helix-turn-helix transcriptional regulator [Salibacterium halotolerans]SFQ27110.1 Helix-turn-helix domain-containing protein [Salibacterium halotolerans]
MEKRTLGNYVRDLRLRNNFSLRDLANETDISYSYIHAIESDRVTPSREIAASLANGLKGALPDEMLRLGGYLPAQRTVDLADAIDMELFALRLEELMSGNDWKVEALAVRTNINKNELHGWLHPGIYQTSSSQSPDIISLYKLAALFHVTPDYLAGAVHDPNVFEPSFPRPKNLRDLLNGEALVLDNIPLDEADKERIIAILYAAFDSK